MTRDGITTTTEYQAVAARAAHMGHELRIVNEDVETIGGQEGREVAVQCPHCANTIAWLRWQVLGDRYAIEDTYSRFPCTQERVHAVEARAAVTR